MTSLEHICKMCVDAPGWDPSYERLRSRCVTCSPGVYQMLFCTVQVLLSDSWPLENLCLDWERE